MVFDTPKDFIPKSENADIKNNNNLLFLFFENQVLIKKEINQITFPKIETVAKILNKMVDLRYFGDYKEIKCFCAYLESKEDIVNTYSWSTLRSLFDVTPTDLLSLTGRAYQITHWDKTNKFCSECGDKLLSEKKNNFKVCPSCKKHFYPKISPAIMVLIKKNSTFLLARSPHFPSGMYSALAGFVENGESLEDTIHREVFEEVGLYVHKISYFSSQPWPFPNSLMIAYNCEYLNGDLKINKNEIEDARWFSKNDLPNVLPNKVSIARKLIDSHIKKLSE